MTPTSRATATACSIISRCRIKNRDTKEPLDYTKRTGYQIYKKALQKGVLLRPLGDVIYFNPPLIITEDDMDFVTNVALECTKEVLHDTISS